MAGTFTIGETKVRPGVYHRYENAGGTAPAGALNGVAAGVLRGSWGPLGELVELEPSSDVRAVFGPGGTVDLAEILFAAGATKGKFVRAGSGGAKARVTLKDSDGADCLTIEGAYVGGRAFTITIRDGLGAGERECLIFEGTTLLLKVGFAAGEKENEALAAALAARTGDFTAAIPQGYSGGGTLAETAQAPFSGGQDPAVTAEDYSKALAVLEPEDYNVLCVDSTDPAVHALVAAFLARTYAAGSYPMACLAETADVALEDRMAHAAAFNDEKIVYCLNGARDAAGQVCDGYRLAARIGGMVASVPSNDTLTGLPVSGLVELEERLTNTQIEAALQKGCLVLSKNKSGQVKVEKGIDTLITPSGDQDAGWKKIRRVKTRFELMGRIDATLDGMRVNNDTNGRAALIAAGQQVINTMIGENKLSGGSMSEDKANPAQGDSAWFVLAVDDVDSLETVYLTYRFRFSADG